MYPLGRGGGSVAVPVQGEGAIMWLSFGLLHQFHLAQIVMSNLQLPDTQVKQHV
jgi:hypothetical protein